MTSNPTPSLRVSRIVDALKHRFGRHINLNEDNLLELAEKVDFIIRIKLDKPAPRQADITLPNISVFVVRAVDGGRDGHRFALVYDTENIVDVWVWDKKPDYAELFTQYSKAVDKLTNDILITCSIERGIY